MTRDFPLKKSTRHPGVGVIVRVSHVLLCFAFCASFALFRFVLLCYSCFTLLYVVFVCFASVRFAVLCVARGPLLCFPLLPIALLRSSLCFDLPQ